MNESSLFLTAHLLDSHLKQPIQRAESFPNEALLLLWLMYASRLSVHLKELTLRVCERVIPAPYSDKTYENRSKGSLEKRTDSFEHHASSQSVGQVERHSL